MPKQYRLSPLFLFIGYPSRRMTSVIDCVASYIAIAFSFFSLAHIIPSFLSVQDFVRRPVPAKYLSGILFLPYHGVKAKHRCQETEGDYG